MFVDQLAAHEGCGQDARKMVVERRRKEQEAKEKEALKAAHDAELQAQVVGVCGACWTVPVDAWPCSA